MIGREVSDSLIQVSNDPNCPPAAEKLLELYEAAGGNALMFDCSLEELQTIRPLLKRIRAIVTISVGDDTDAAREAVDTVRELSNIG